MPYKVLEITKQTTLILYIFQRICFNCDICESLIIVVKRIVLVTCGFTTTIGMNIVLRCHKIAKNKRKMKFTICNNIFSISLISIAFKHDNSENGRQVHETYFLRCIATMGKSLSDCYISTTKWCNRLGSKLRDVFCLMKVFC